jgi:hypothetical protein
MVRLILMALLVATSPALADVCTPDDTVTHRAELMAAPDSGSTPSPEIVSQIVEKWREECLNAETDMKKVKRKRYIPTPRALSTDAPSFMEIK